MSWKLSLSHWGAFEASVVDDKIESVRPFARDPNPSPLLQSIPSSVHSDARIRRPMVREGFLKRREKDSDRRRGGEPFVELSWDDALDLIAGEIARVRTDHGNHAIFGGSYGWASAGRVNHAPTLVQRCLFAAGGCIDQTTNYSYATAMTLLPHIVGGSEPVSGYISTWPTIIENTKLMLLFGGLSEKNSFVTTGGAGAHEFMGWLRRARESGVEFINISPIASDTPEFLDARWLPIRPGSDTALILALAFIVASEGYADQEFLDRYTTGYGQFKQYLFGEVDGVVKNARWASELTEIDEATIIEIAHRLGRERSMLTATWSLQRADHGEQPYWSLIALAAMLGHIGLPGGGFAFGYGSINGMGTPRPGVASLSMEAGRNPLARSIPVARISDMLLNPGTPYDYNGTRAVYPDIRLIYWAGGNPFHHHQDINRLLRAWSRPETIIVNEIWWTATAKHADIVLPATTAYERNDIGSSPRDRFIIAMKQLIPPQAQARNDYDIFADLSDRLGSRDGFTEGLDIHGWIERVYERFRKGSANRGFDIPCFQEFMAAGFIELPAPEAGFTLMEDFRRDPDVHALKTPSGKIEIFSETIAGFDYDDCPGHPTWLPPKEWLGAPLVDRFPLHVISNQPATRLHAQLDCGSVSAKSKVGGREPLLMNSADAEKRSIRSGDIVRVHNDRGECLAGVVVTDVVRPGVIQLSTGAWFDPVEPGLIGSLDKHGNPNMLSRDQGTSRLGQGPSALSALVEVEVWTDEVPPITAFDGPRLA